MAGARTGSSAVVSVAEQTSQQTQWLRVLEPAEPIFEAYPQQYTQTSVPYARSGKKKNIGRHVAFGVSCGQNMYVHEESMMWAGQRMGFAVHRVGAWGIRSSSLIFSVEELHNDYSCVATRLK